MRPLIEPVLYSLREIPEQLISKEVGGGILPRFYGILRGKFPMCKPERTIPLQQVIKWTMNYTKITFRQMKV